MKDFYLIHLGIGNVGKELVKQILHEKNHIRDKHQVNLNYCGLYNSRGGEFDPEGFNNDKLIKILDHLEKKRQQNGINEEILNIINDVHQPLILIDTTASEKTFPIIFSTLARRGFAVLSNKKPLTLRQEQFDLLHQLGRERLFFETTVGAALPVISSLKSLLDTGDEIIEITGCFSGTLGFICSSIEDGISFSESVKQAKEKGFTEPDPRDDLSGQDVGRKALILARILGQKIEMSDIKLQALYPDSYNNYSVSEFMEEIKNLDRGYTEKFHQALNKGNTLRYLAKVTQKSVYVSLTEVSKQSDVGNLKGPDNIIVFKTQRYLDRPIVIKGPGAGVEVTASGVFGDILNIVNMT